MKPIVSIIMGSTSDLPIMEKAAKLLDECEIPFEMLALSAHRTPAQVEEFAKGAKARGIKAGRHFEGGSFLALSGLCVLAGKHIHDATRASPHRLRHHGSCGCGRSRSSGSFGSRLCLAIAGLGLFTLCLRIGLTGSRTGTIASRTPCK